MLVLDTSRSMASFDGFTFDDGPQGNSRLQYAVDSARLIAESLARTRGQGTLRSGDPFNLGVQFGLITFNSEVAPLNHDGCANVRSCAGASSATTPAAQGYCELPMEALDSVNDALDSVTADLLTDMEAALRFALEPVRLDDDGALANDWCDINGSPTVDPNNYAIVLITDGFHNPPDFDPNSMDELLAELGSTSDRTYADVPIWTIGVSLTSDVRTLDRIAGLTNAKSHVVHHGSELLPTVFEVLAEIEGHELSGTPSSAELAPEWSDGVTVLQHNVDVPADSGRLWILVNGSGEKDFGPSVDVLDPSGDVVASDRNEVAVESDWVLLDFVRPMEGRWTVRVTNQSKISQRYFVATRITGPAHGCDLLIYGAPHEESREIEIVLNPHNFGSLQPWGEYRVEVTPPFGESEDVPVEVREDGLIRGTYTPRYRGVYDFAASCNTPAGTELRPGEAVFPGTTPDFESSQFQAYSTRSVYVHGEKPVCIWEDDCDGDKIPNDADGYLDRDLDGLLNAYDWDSDNDEIPDFLERHDDIDEDGVANFVDLDSDGDQVPDVLDNCPYVRNPTQERKLHLLWETRAVRFSRKAVVRYPESWALVLQSGWLYC